MKAHRPTKADLDISSDSEQEAALPGPGSYIDIQKHSIFNVEKKDGFFDRQSQRFPKEKFNMDRGLDPGNYNVGNFKLTDYKKKGYTAAFANGERFQKTKVMDGPGPDKYYAPSIYQDILKKVTSKKEGFGSEAARFVKPPSNIFEEQPGPGEYNPIDSIKTLE